MIKRASLKENLISLLLLQGSNYIIPLITLPYLVRVLGPEKFGLLAFAQGFVQYFVILTDYGFNLSATRLIAINRDSPNKISEIFCSTMLVKILLMAIGLAVMASIVVLVPKFRHDWMVYFLAFLSVPGNVFFPVWLFQGVEQMRYISIVTIGAKLLSAFSIFIFVRNDTDYLIAAAIQSGGLLVVSLLGIGMVRKVVPLNLAWPTINSLKETLSEGWHIFLSTAAVSLYTTSNIFILGLITNNVTVGYFSAADKLISAAKGLIGPVSQAIYPRVNALVLESPSKALAFIRRSLAWLGGAALLVSCSILVLATPIVQILLSQKYDQSICLVRLMAFVPFVVAFTNVFGTQTMLTFNMKVAYSRLIIVSGFFNLLLFVPLAITMGATGAAIAVMITETLIPVTMAVYLKTRGVNLFTSKEAAYVI